MNGRHWVWVGVLLLIAAVWAQSYQGRIDVWQSDLNACAQRDNPGRISRVIELNDSASVWEIHGEPGLAARQRARAAATQARIVDCRTAFPRPGFWPHF